MQSQLSYKPWAIFCTAKTCKPECIARFVNRRDAEEHLIFLRRSVPQASFVLVSDINESQL
ncbi:MAG: hypothetical protein PUP90_02330 [Nostoc sp. S4]|nr:hypothetical protein [Nostoc sp. S4]